MGSRGGKEGFDSHAKTPHYQRWQEFAGVGGKDENEEDDDDDESDNTDTDNSPFTRAPIGYAFRTPVVSESENRPPSDNQESAPETTSSNSDTVSFLDGGIGHELKQRGIIADDGSFLAGILANERQPSTVKEVHSAFCQRAGCSILTTNSFVAVPQRVQQDLYHAISPMDKHSGVPTEETVLKRTRELIQAAVKCTKDVATKENDNRRRAGRELVKIAGTVPPLTECYIASAVPHQIHRLVAPYSFILSTLIEEGVDLLLGETLSTAREGIAIVRALSKVLARKLTRPCVPLFISFTVDDFIQPTVLRSGESLKSAVDSILEEAEISGITLGAIGVNCASPTAVTIAIPILAECLRRRCRFMATTKILAYANAFQTTTTEWLVASGQIGALGQPFDYSRNNSFTSTDTYDQYGLIRPESYAVYAEKWRELGASIIGGCCGCSPLHMQAVSDKFASRSILGHKNVAV